MSSDTYKKRQKELARQQRKEEKANSEPPRDGEDPDLAGIVPGPQPRTW
jgi:hypothetical protein